MAAATPKRFLPQDAKSWAKDEWQRLFDQQTSSPFGYPDPRRTQPVENDVAEAFREGAMEDAEAATYAEVGAAEAWAETEDMEFGRDDHGQAPDDRTGASLHSRGITGADAHVDRIRHGVVSREVTRRPPAAAGGRPEPWLGPGEESFLAGEGSFLKGLARLQSGSPPRREHSWVLDPAVQASLQVLRYGGPQPQPSIQHPMTMHDARRPAAPGRSPPAPVPPTAAELEVPHSPQSLEALVKLTSDLSTQLAKRDQQLEQDRGVFRRKLYEGLRRERRLTSRLLELEAEQEALREWIEHLDVLSAEQGQKKSPGRAQTPPTSRPGSYLEKAIIQVRGNGEALREKV
jgi:hypothetical protein